MKRFLIYILFSAVYVGYTFLYLSVLVNLFKDIITGLIVSFSILNWMFSYFHLKTKAVFGLVISILIPVLSFMLVFYTNLKGWYPNTDYYGIITAIILNALFPIIFWEIIYRLQLKFPTYLNREITSSPKKP